MNFIIYSLLIPPGKRIEFICIPAFPLQADLIYLIPETTLL
jgi:hypothetical protein